MLEKLKLIRNEALAEINQCQDLKQLNEIRIKYLGKKGPIQEAMKQMKNLTVEERKTLGQVANETKQTIFQEIENKEEILNDLALKQRLLNEKIDVTLPARKINIATKHIMTQLVEEIEDIFIGMGYEIAEGPEVETDLYNFEMMNLPKNHPARDMQDSFYITDELLLRTHTSPVQARTMLSYQGIGPVKMICPGKVYRRDDDDATHSHQFFQIEGLVIDENITMSDLKGTLDYFVKKIFGSDRKIRFRPSFFPFTEPSVEVDVSCAKCQTKGCNICKNSGYIEILGAGMVHPNVLKMGGFDPEKYQGFAFGLGVERIAMLKYGIDDIRQFYTNDLRFNYQFK